MSIFHKSHNRHTPLTALLVGTGVVFFWRGVWGLFDVLIFPDTPILSYSLSLIAGIAILAGTHYLVKELM